MRKPPRPSALPPRPGEAGTRPGIDGPRPGGPLESAGVFRDAAAPAAFFSAGVATTGFASGAGRMEGLFCGGSGPESSAGRFNSLR